MCIHLYVSRYPHRAAGIRLSTRAGELRRAVASGGVQDSHLLEAVVSAELATVTKLE